jgi:hypothetical protein
MLGAGPRLKLLKKENARIYIAALYMYEYDDIINDDVNLNEHRLSSYLTCSSFTLLKNIDFTTTTFYQPNIENTADYRIANDSGLRNTY